MTQINRRDFIKTVGIATALGDPLAADQAAWGATPGADPVPPPVTGVVELAEIVAHAAGRISLRVSIRPGVLRNVGNLVLGTLPAQSDNPRTDLNGWLRSFTLCAIVPAAGRYRLRTAGVRTPSQRLAAPSPVTVTVNGQAPATRVERPDFRDGPVCRELVYRLEYADDIHVHVHQQVWADGATCATVIFENGWSVPGQRIARTRGYAAEARLGSDRWNYSVRAHVPYARWLRRLGPQPADAQPVPVGWTGDADTGTWEFFKTALAIPNYTADPGVPNLATIDRVGDVPFPAAAGGVVGPFTSEQGGPGDNPDIGLFPIYHMQALRHLRAGGLRMLRESADLRMGVPYFLRRKDTGAFHRPDEGFNYAFDARWSNGPNLIGAVNGPAPANQMWEAAHWGSSFYIPYLVTGDLAYLEGQVIQEFFSWAVAPFVWERGTPPFPLGSGMDRHSYTCKWDRFWDCGDPTPTGFPQERQMGWAVRTTVQTLASLPDDDARTRALLGWDKTVTRTLWRNVQASLHRCYVIGSTERFPPGSFRRTQAQQGHFVSWMQGTILVSLGHGCELGSMTPEGIAFTKWFLEGRCTPILDPRFNAEMMVDQGNIYTTKDRKINSWASPRGEGAPARTPEEVYRATKAPDWPEPGARPPLRRNLHDGDWAGYWADAAVFAVDLGVPGGRGAHEWFKALAQRMEGRPYFYGPKHAIVPRSAAR